MNEAAWDRLTDSIDVRFGIAKHGREERQLPDAPQLTAAVQFIEFERGGERYRLERVTSPAIIERKTMGAHRIGAELHYQNIYDPEELTSRVVFLRNESGEWTSIEPDSLGLS